MNRVPPNRQEMSTELHGVTSHKTLILLFQK